MGAKFRTLGTEYIFILSLPLLTRDDSQTLSQLSKYP